VLVSLLMLVACQTQRVEYHRRPAFYERASNQRFDQDVVTEDGTIIRYRSAHRGGILGHGSEQQGKMFQMREEHEDGSVTLNALLPEHVLVNFLTCLRNEEYALFYEQMLATHTKREFERSENGVHGFTAYLQRHRHDLAGTLTRMVAGIPSQETSFTSMPDGVIRCRLRPQIAEPFKFKGVDVVKEGPGLKLLMIH
jgi:hypothetical protein